MRPGLDGPGKPNLNNFNIVFECSFNEAGAGWPRKTISKQIGQRPEDELQ